VLLGEFQPPNVELFHYKESAMTQIVIRFKHVLMAGLVGVTGLCGRGTYAQTDPYQLVPGWESEELVGVEAIAVDKNDNVFAAQRCQANWSNTCISSLRQPIVEFNPDGKVINEFGLKQYVFIHGLYVDKDNNLWATDAKGVFGHGEQVFKYSPESKLLMTLGKAGVAGDGPDTFHGPNSVVVAENGDIFVADGHGVDGCGGYTNARIVKFDKNGKFIKAWGKMGTGPLEFGMFHGLAMDSKGRLFVGDRGNGRIEIYDQEGNLLDTWEQFGAPAGMFIDQNDMLYVASGPGGDVSPPKSGVSWGIRVGSATDGVVRYLIPPEAGIQASGLAADSHGTIYASDVKTWHVAKYILKK
jgi:sugar lactone lactonase YvrE